MVGILLHGNGLWNPALPVCDFTRKGMQMTQEASTTLTYSKWGYTVYLHVDHRHCIVNRVWPHSPAAKLKDTEYCYRAGYHWRRRIGMRLCK